ncbi:MAG TPA: toll/interleukin-1 receptor domain-containing protein, partial [Pyrinomonadaceae bacterium]|nr:toll/interleukin-1 receptor domain-containing protein [Pyrinomonadaceae bacterium]
MMRNKVFISYSHRDERWLNRLRVHLRPLERNYMIEVWDDTRMTPGANWRDAIADAISSAKVGILLISADFLASDFIVNNELPSLLEAAKNGGATILCIIVNPCRFERTPELAHFQTINNPNKPLAKLPVAEREAVWVRVADAVEACFEERTVTEGWLVRN